MNQRLNAILVLYFLKGYIGLDQNICARIKFEVTMISNYSFRLFTSYYMLPNVSKSDVEPETDCPSWKQQSTELARAAKGWVGDRALLQLRRHGAERATGWAGSICVVLNKLYPPHANNDFHHQKPKAHRRLHHPSPQAYQAYLFSPHSLSYFPSPSPRHNSQ